MKTKTPADPAKLRELSCAIDRVSSSHGAKLALHARLRLAILNTIHAGQWAAGDRLPAETDLATATRMSLGTVQRALRTLTEEGVVRRQQGSGSFVATAPHRIDDVAHCRFLDEDGSVLPVFSSVLGRQTVGRKGPWTAHFPAKANVVRLDRLLDVNDEFDVLSHFYFDGARIRGLASRAVTELAGANFKLLLAQEARVPPGGTSQTMRLVRAQPDIARPLSIPAGHWIAQLDIIRRIAGIPDVLYYQQMFVPPTARALVTQEVA